MEKELFRNFSDLFVRNEDESVVLGSDVSCIAHGAVMKGDISSRTDMRIDGQIEGKLYSEGCITVGETANVTGSIVCSDLELWGKIEGDIYVKDMLSVKGSAVVDGNIHVRKIQVEMGARINGSFHMINEEEFNELRAGVISTEIPEPVVKKTSGIKLPSAKEEKAKMEARFGIQSSVQPSQPVAAETAVPSSRVRTVPQQPAPAAQPAPAKTVSAKPAGKTLVTRVSRPAAPKAE